MSVWPLITGAGDDTVFLYGLNKELNLLIHTGSGDDTVHLGGPERRFTVIYPASNAVYTIEQEKLQFVAAYLDGGQLVPVPAGDTTKPLGAPTDFSQMNFVRRNMENPVNGPEITGPDGTRITTFLDKWIQDENADSIADSINDWKPDHWYLLENNLAYVLAEMARVFDNTGQSGGGAFTARFANSISRDPVSHLSVAESWREKVMGRSLCDDFWSCLFEAFNSWIFFWYDIFLTGRKDLNYYPASTLTPYYGSPAKPANQLVGPNNIAILPRDNIATDQFGVPFQDLENGFASLQARGQLSNFTNYYLKEAVNATIQGQHLSNLIESRVDAETPRSWNPVNIWNVFPHVHALWHSETYVGVLPDNAFNSDGDLQRWDSSTSAAYAKADYEAQKPDPWPAPTVKGGGTDGTLFWGPVLAVL